MVAIPPTAAATIQDTIKPMLTSPYDERVHSALSVAPPQPPPPEVFRHPVRVYWEDTDAGGVVFVPALTHSSLR